MWACLLALPFSAISQTEIELKEKANSLFNNESYVEATSLYLRLLSLQPRDYSYNYRYGTCLLYNSDRKQEAFKYLNYASKGENVEKEVFYFLGKAYHLSYQFQKAIQYYENYKKLAGENAVARLDVDRQIEMCKNGKQLLNNLTKLIVISKQQISISDFFRLYNLNNIGGTLLITQDFQSKTDKKNNQVPLIHFPDNPKMIFYSSYGDNAKTGLDIFVRKRLPDGSWSLPQLILGDVNTKYDENYPFLQAGGDYLYFSSKGHNSMGGYDVFRAKYNPDDDSFGDVENVDFAVSSPDDDLFYVVDSLNQNAYFASARESQSGKINVYKVRVERVPDQMVIFKGELISKINPDQKVAKIEVVEHETGKKIGSYTSSRNDGGYLITIPKAGKYDYIVQIEGSKETHTAIVDAPYSGELRPIKQTIFAYMENGKEHIKIVNVKGVIFDNQEEILAEVYANQSKLEPNSNDFNLDSLNSVGKQRELLSKVGLANYSVQELAPIANTDVKILTSEIDEKKIATQKLIQVANQAIEDAQESNQKSEALMAEAKLDSSSSSAKNLVNQSIAQKENAINQTIKAELAQELAKEAVASMNDDKSQLENAKKVEALFKDVKESNLISKVASTDPAVKNYLERNFNQTKSDDFLSTNQSVTEIKKRDEINTEIARVEKAINERNTLISKLEAEKLSANKKTKEEIERTINKAQDENVVDNELLARRKSQRQLIADKSFENQIKQNIVAEINMMSDTSSLANLTSSSTDLAIKELNAKAKETSLKQLQEQGNQLITSISAKETLAATMNNESIKVDSVEEVAKVSSKDYLEERFPNLIKSEQAVKTTKGTTQEKKQAELTVQKEWADAISKSIKEQENKIAENPNDKASKELLAELNTLQNEKQSSITQLEKDIEKLEKPVVENKVNYKVENKETPTEKVKITNSDVLAALSNDYQTQHDELANKEATKENLKTLNILDSSFLEQIKKRNNELASVTSDEASQEKKILAANQSKIEKDILKRYDLIASIKEPVKEPTKDPVKELVVDTVPEEIPTNENLLPGFEEKLAIIKANTNEKKSQKDELKLQQELVVAIEKRENTLKAQLKENPENISASSSLDELAQLKVVTTNNIATLEQKQLVETNVSSDTANLTVESLRNELLPESDAWSFSNNIISEDSLTQQRDILSTYLSRLKEKQTTYKGNRLTDSMIKDEITQTNLQLKTIDQKIVVNTIAVNNKTILKQKDSVKVVGPKVDSVKVVEPTIDNNQVIKPENDLVALQNKEADLQNQLIAAEGKEKKSLEKELKSTQEAKEKVQLVELTTQKAETAQLVANLNSAVESTNNTSLKLQQLTINDQLKETEFAIDRIDEVKPRQQSKQIALAQYKKDELNASLKEQQTALVIEKIKTDLLLASGQPTNRLTSQDELVYQNNTIDDKTQLLEQQLRDLEQKKLKAKKKEIPAIDAEIEKIKGQIAELDAIKIANTTQIELLQEHYVNNENLLNVSNTLALPSDDDVIRIAQQKEYAKVKNDWNELQLLTQREQNLKLAASNTKSGIENDIQQMVVETSPERKDSIQVAAVIKMNNLQKQEDEIIYLEKQIHDLNTELIDNLLLLGNDRNMAIAMATNGVKTAGTKVVTNQTTNEQSIVNEGLQFSTTPVYSASNPIPIKEITSKGLVYRIQIGAFVSPVDPENFKEFSPVVGEKIPNSKWIRYVVGEFGQKNGAVEAQRKVRTLGYSDAFVVAYCDGQRVTMAQADIMVKKGECTPNEPLFASTAIQTNVNNTNSTEVSTQNSTQVSSKQPDLSSVEIAKLSSYNQAPNATVATAVEITKGLFYTVQVGVYNSPVSKERLFNIQPLFTQLTDAKQIRYSTGKFDGLTAAVNRKNEVRTIGIPDAYVTAYYNGKRISVAEARKLLDENGTSILMSQMEKQDSTELKQEGKQTIILDSSSVTRKRLNPLMIQTKIVSKETYYDIPRQEIQKWNDVHIWAYYNAKTNRIESLTNTNSSGIPSSAQQIKMYQGFEIDTTKGLYFASLKNVDYEKAYSELEVSWVGDMPLLLSDWLQKNTYPISEIDLGHKKIIFEPLEYEEKERLQTILNRIESVKIQVKNLLWE